MKAQTVFAVLVLIVSTLGLAGCDSPIVDRSTTVTQPDVPTSVLFTIAGTVAQVGTTSELQLVDSSKPRSEIGAVNWRLLLDGVFISSGFAEGGVASTLKMTVPGPGPKGPSPWGRPGNVALEEGEQSMEALIASILDAIASALAILALLLKRGSLVEKHDQATDGD